MGKFYSSFCQKNIVKSTHWIRFSLGIIIFLLWNLSVHQGLAKSQIQYGGDHEIDFHMESQDKDDVDSKSYFYEGRGVWYIQSIHEEKDWITEGKVAGEFKLSGEVEAEDIFLKYGKKNVWDMTVGRFEAWKFYGLGLDDGIPTVGKGIFVIDDLRGRDSGALMIQYHLSPTYFQLNLMNRKTTELDDLMNSHDINEIGIRPAVRFQMDQYVILFGSEFISKNPSIQGTKYTEIKNNYGLRCDYEASKIQAGISVAAQKVSGKRFDGSRKDELTQFSYGAHGALELYAGTVGVGLYKNEHKDRAEIKVTTTDTIAYLSYILSFGEKLKMRLTASQSTAEKKEGNSQALKDRMTALRIRFFYEFES